MSAIDDCEERIQKEAYQRGYEQGKKDALLQKENLQISTVIGYESGHEEGAKAEREWVLESLDGLRKYANAEYKEAELSDNEREMRIHLEYENRIWGIMQPLHSPV